MNKFFLNLFLLFLSVELNAATVDTIAVYSPSMKKSIKTCVILPDGYKKNGKAYPVLYLLHGHSGNYTSWVNDFPITQELSDQYSMIIVSPDGGYSSWYLDSPIDSSFKYETFVSKELIGRIDQNYMTLKKPSGRAISGLSMGGHGALYLAFRHPDVFGAAGSMSGGVDIRPFPNNWDIAKRLGSIQQYPDNWEKNSVINLVGLAKDANLALIIDCGVADFFINVNRQLHRKLLELKIPHDYTERPGEHNRPYWDNSIRYHALFFHQFFQRSK
jgi:S-formylglutathione hydrolase FrmB